jgi:hypothetical protein
MMISLFIILFLAAILIFIKGMDDDAVAYQGISLVMFLVIAGLSFYITIPMQDPATSTIVEHRYIEWSILPISLGFVFIDLVWLITHWFDFRKMKRGDVPYVPPGHQ